MIDLLGAAGAATQLQLTHRVALQDLWPHMLVESADTCVLS